MFSSGVANGSHLLVGCLVPALVLCATPTRALAADVPPACTPIVARIVSMQGVVEMRKAGQQDWATVTRLDTPVCQGDAVHAGPRSRAALVILPEKFVRLDQNSTVSISIDGDETVVEFFQDETTPRDACGAGYFITRFPRKFKVRTPFVNAAVEGTEFLVSMTCSATSIAVFEGKVSAEALLSNAERFILSSGETISVGPREPPATQVLVKPVDAVQWALYYPPLSAPDPGVGPDQQCEQPTPDERSPCLMLRAEQRLRVGRVDEAQADVQASLKLAPDSSDADALLSVISVVKNDKQRALAVAHHATQLDPVNPRGWIALSYAQQASFKLEDALASSQRAAELEPRSSIALTRVAELMMSLGKIRSAERAAQAAVNANSNDSRAHAILGFVHLAAIDIKRAQADFEAAISRDSSDPLPRLGLGLTIIRGGNLTAGREQIEIAVALDPTNSLIRSYMGKTYYEEDTKERDKLAATQFGLAEQLDPKDPTPWFYEAIMKQTQNQPVEALEDLQKSIELNNNRAVYRSRLLLDEDAASRSASVARIYQNLGFDQSGLSEATKSLDQDPGSYSAHRFLADVYATTPRSEIARSSELLQAQLRQPLGSPPLQPQIANDIFTLFGASGPTSVGLNEFNPLFFRNGLSLQLYGVAGSQNTNGEQVIVNGLTGPLAFSASQFRFDTGGFKDNNDNRIAQYDGFVQLQISEQTSIQVEVTSSEQQFGDLIVSFDPSLASVATNKTTIDISRIGVRQQLSSTSDLLVSAIHTSRRDTKEIAGFGPIIELSNDTNKVEAQNLLKTSYATFVTGIGYFWGDTNEEFFFTPSSDKPYQFNAYGYAYIPIPALRMTGQLGLSFDHLNALSSGDTQQVNPKLGVVWTPTDTTTVRAATFRVLRRRINADEGLEPTQVAGFNQYYDDNNGASSRKTAVALDQRLYRNLTVGFELGKRNISSPLANGATIDHDAWKERYGLAYIYDAPARWVGLTATALWQQYERPPGASTDLGFTSVETWYFPLSLRLFANNGLSAVVTPMYVNQRGTFYRLDPSFNLELFDGQSSFWVTDLFLNYRLPGRYGVITAGVRNLFDAHFQYQSIDPTGSAIAMRRLAFIRASLSF